MYAALSGLSDQHVYTGEIEYTVGGMMSSSPDGIEDDFNAKILGFAKMLSTSALSNTTKLILCVD